MEWLINRRRMMYNKAVPPAYLTFEDEGIWRICCENFGDYNETTITDNGDGTVNIVVTFKSMLNNVVKKSKIISTQTNVDNTEGTYVEGTTKEAVGITMKQCKAVSASNIGYNNNSVFKQPITVSNFKEFRYFTGVTTTDGRWFQGLTITGTLILPKSITSYHSYLFYQSSINAVVLDEGTVNPPSSSSTFYYCNASLIVFPSTITSISNMWNNSSNRRDVIINTNTVIPVGSQSYLRANSPLYIYVKDELVDAFKEDESWSTNVGASKIYPLSEYTGSY